MTNNVIFYFFKFELRKVVCSLNHHPSLNPCLKYPIWWWGWYDPIKTQNVYIFKNVLNLNCHKDFFMYQSKKKGTLNLYTLTV